MTTRDGAAAPQTRVLLASDGSTTTLLHALLGEELRLRQAQEFSHTLLNLLHGTGGEGQPRAFADRLRRSAIEQITGDGAQARSFAVSYVG